MSSQHNPKRSGKAAISISFDFETSAQSPLPSYQSWMKSRLYNITNAAGITAKDLSSGYGRGYGNRIGAEKILTLFNHYGIKATWFSTGHVLLKENTKKNGFRINQILEYASSEAGFTSATTWRRTQTSFYHEPYANNKKYPWFYLGDLARRMMETGQDIQCHTFSHPYVSMEAPDNIRTDLEDWQRTALKEGFEKSTIFAFPFLGDYHLESGWTKMKTVPVAAPKGAHFTPVHLSDTMLDIFRKNGFELFTRCGSLHETGLISGFIPYRGSDIYCMKDRGLLSFIEIETFRNFIDEVVDKAANVDLWLHPNDIMPADKFALFSSFVVELAKRRDKGDIRLCTIKEQWEDFKNETGLCFNSGNP